MEKAWWVETYEKAIISDRKEIDYYTRDIEWLGKQIARERQSDKEMLEWVWGKGVLTESQMKYYGDPKKYVGLETAKYIRDRERQYRRRKKAIARLAKDEAWLERVKGW